MACCRRWCYVLVILLLELSFVSSGSIVKNLPGFGDLPFKLETGYIGVGEAEEVQLFYYFVESQRNPTTDPLLLFFVGGPGCSAFSAFFYENGPLEFNNYNFKGSVPELQLNPNTWTKVLSILYVDMPVISGFSYSKTQQGYYSNDKLWVEQSYEFLQKWLIDHREFESNPLYIGGGSYAGRPVAPLIQKVYEGYKVGLQPRMNIQGYVLASPATDMHMDKNTRVQYAYHHTLISNELYESIKDSCNGDYVNINPNNAKCKSDYEAYSELVRDIELHNILEPICLSGSNENERILSQELKTTRKSSSWCRENLFAIGELWANDATVQKALNIREGTKESIKRCNRSAAYTTDIPSVVEYYHNLTNTNLRALIYCSDLDMAIPHISTKSMIKSFDLEVNKTWHAWFVDDQVAGYTEAYKKKNFYLTYVIFKGSGHVAQYYTPGVVYEMIERWFSYHDI